VLHSLLAITIFWVQRTNNDSPFITELHIGSHDKFTFYSIASRRINYNRIASLLSLLLFVFVEFEIKFGNKLKTLKLVFIFFYKVNDPFKSSSNKGVHLRLNNFLGSLICEDIYYIINVLWETKTMQNMVNIIHF
jgi:hypothetical protein